MQRLFVWWAQIKNSLRIKCPKLFKFLKSISQFWLLRAISEKLSPPTERFDPTRNDAEFDYVEAYSSIILNNITTYGKADVAVLDIGSGYGHVTEKIANHPLVKSVVAVDKIKSAQFRIRHSKISFRQHDITKLYLDTDIFPSFDIVTSTEFIEHIYEADAQNLFFWINKHMNDGGLFTGSTPLNKTADSTYSGSPFHLREYSLNDFRKLLETASFKSINLVITDDFFTWQAFK